MGAFKKRRPSIKIDKGSRRHKYAILNIQIYIRSTNSERFTHDAILALNIRDL